MADRQIAREQVDEKMAKKKVDLERNGEIVSVKHFLACHRGQCVLPIGTVWYRHQFAVARTSKSSSRRSEWFRTKFRTEPGSGYTAPTSTIG
jgi:hypothetical protein